MKTFETIQNECENNIKVRANCTPALKTVVMDEIKSLKRIDLRIEYAEKLKEEINFEITVINGDLDQMFPVIGEREKLMKKGEEKLEDLYSIVESIQEEINAASLKLYRGIIGILVDRIV